MMTQSERRNAVLRMRRAVLDFYSTAVKIRNHPFVEFAGIMTEYVNACEDADEHGVDFSDCSKHSGAMLPMEDFQVDYVNEKLECIFGDRVMMQHNHDLEA